MKKIILILFLFLSCYIIFNLTEDKTKKYMYFGDINTNVSIYPKENIYEYVNQDYRIKDLISIIKNNEENSMKIPIHRLLNNTDILIISIGMNDLYYKLNKDTKNIYTYLNEMLNNMNTLLNEINTYKYEKVLILGYYNISKDNNDIFTYINYKLSKVVKEYSYEFIDLNNILKNNSKYYKNDKNYTLNIQGYEEINKIIVEKIKKY